MDGVDNSHTEGLAMRYAKHIMCLMNYGSEDADMPDQTGDAIDMATNLQLGQPIDRRFLTDNESGDPLPPFIVDSIKKLEEKYRQSLRAIEYPGIHAHVRRWSYPLSPGSCNATVNGLIVLVSSAPDRLTSRNAIRSTWGDRKILLSTQSRLVFVVGQSTDADAEMKLRQELDKNRDVLQVDMYDSYYNLSLKTIGMLNWVKDQCQSAVFVAKIDDDMMASIPNLLKFAEKTVKTHIKFIAGDRREGGVPHKEGKYLDPIFDAAFKKGSYPAFLAGPGYIMSSSVVAELLINCENSSFLHLEDVFVTGVCAEGIPGLQKLPLPGFSINRQEGCALVSKPEYTLIHGYGSSELVSAWSAMRTGELCMRKPIRRWQPYSQDYMNLERRRQYSHDPMNLNKRRQYVQDYINPEKRRRYPYDYINSEKRQKYAQDYVDPERRRHYAQDNVEPERRRQYAQDHINAEKRRRVVYQRQSYYEPPYVDPRQRYAAQKNR